VAETLRQTLQSTLLEAWRGRGVLASLLYPISLTYRALVWTRRAAFGFGLVQVQHVDATVIVVGNVVAGGAGKTPTVIAVVQYLMAQQHRVGVISRGYGRAGTACVEVLPTADPRDVGDEPLLIRRATGVPVFVASTRHEAAIALLAHHPQTQFIICDDGLQHYALYRDLEICVFDDRGCGNGWHLPAGPLRERWPRHAVLAAGQRDDRLLVLHTGERPAFAGFTARKNLSSMAHSSDGTQIPLAALHTPGGKPLMAVAGIAQPESFFAMLRARNVPLAATLALSDHYHFDSGLINKYEGYRLICTDKDAAKLWPLVPDAVTVSLEFQPEVAFFAALDAQVRSLLAAKLSSAHGHKTS
jgi:tetraacyldisaccharide 4'-kinase